MNTSIKQINKILNSMNHIKINVIVYQTKVPTIHTPDSFIIQKKNNYHRQIGCNTVNLGEHACIAQLCQAMSRPLFNSKKYVWRF